MPLERLSPYNAGARVRQDTTQQSTMQPTAPDARGPLGFRLVSLAPDQDGSNPYWGLTGLSYNPETAGDLDYLWLVEASYDDAVALDWLIDTDYAHQYIGDGFRMPSVWLGDSGAFLTGSYSAVSEDPGDNPHGPIRNSSKIIPVPPPKALAPSDGFKSPVGSRFRDTWRLYAEFQFFGLNESVPDDLFIYQAGYNVSTAAYKRCEWFVRDPTEDQSAFGVNGSYILYSCGYVWVPDSLDFTDDYDIVNNRMFKTFADYLSQYAVPRSLFIPDWISSSDRNLWPADFNERVIISRIHLCDISWSFDPNVNYGLTGHDAAVEYAKLRPFISRVNGNPHRRLTP